MYKMTEGCYGDIWTWIQDEDIHERLFRVWFNPNDNGEECQFFYFTQFIELPNKDILIGMQAFDEWCEGNKYETVEYRLLSQIQFNYVPSDQE